MIAIGGGASVAAEQELAAVLKHAYEHIGGGVQRALNPRKRGVSFYQFGYVLHFASPIATQIAA